MNKLLLAAAAALAITMAACTTDPVAVTAEPVAEVVTDCLDVDAGVDAMDAVHADLNASQDAVRTFDIDGAVRAVRDAAVHSDQGADAVAADPDVYAALSAASDDFDASADALAAGDIRLATSYMQDAGADMDDATVAIKATTIDRC